MTSRSLILLFLLSSDLFSLNYKSSVSAFSYFFKKKSTSQNFCSSPLQSEAVRMMFHALSLPAGSWIYLQTKHFSATVFFHNDPPMVSCALLSNFDVLSLFSCIRLPATLWTAPRQAPLPTGFSRREHWSGLPCPPPGDRPDPGIERVSLKPAALAGRFSPRWWQCTILRESLWTLLKISWITSKVISGTLKL